VRLLLAGVLTLCLLSPVWAKGPPSAQDDGKGKANGKTKLKGWRFVVFGDHRGNNALTNINPEKTAYLDGGFNKAVLEDLAAAIKSEDVQFVLEVGDLVTKWQQPPVVVPPLPPYFVISADELMATQFADWGATWIAASGGLPIYPVRGNQEWTASAETWKAFTKTMPGIGTLAPNGPPGEEGLTFCFKHKSCLFIGVDQYASPLANGDSHVITPEALAWIDQQLSESDKPYKFVFGHVPAFETWNSKKKPFAAVKDGLATPYALFTPAAIAMRDAFWSSLGSAGAEYFCGHEHMYGRGVTTDAAAAVLRQTIIGNGGAPLVPLFPADYAPLGVYCESYTYDPVTKNYELPGIPSVRLSDPLIATEAAARTAEVGYIVVQVHGSKVTAKYVAAPADIDTNVRTGPFAVKDTWTIAEGDDDEEVEEAEEEEAEAATR
jgi:hypothetical protein